MRFRRQKICCLYATGFILLLWAFLTSARAASYTFTPIADTTGPFKTLGLPALTTQGRVAFFATLDNGGQGVFRKDGEFLRTIADDQGSFLRFSDPDRGATVPSINTQGMVAFWAVRKDATQGIFSGQGRQLTTIADDQGSLQMFGLFPSINDSGVVAFWATTDAGGSGVFTGQGGPLTTVADTGEAFSGFGVPMINSRGWVAFLAERADPPLFGVIMRRRAATRILIDKFGDSPLPLQGVLPPQINVQGTVIFVADLQGQAFVLFSSDGEKIKPIADNQGTGPVRFLSFSPPALNNQGNIAFAAQVDDALKRETYTGIFAGPDPVADQVIRTGATLADSTITALQMFREGLNDEGQIAFHATLADGVERIYRADPLPR